MDIGFQSVIVDDMVPTFLSEGPLVRRPISPKAR